MIKEMGRRPRKVMRFCLRKTKRKREKKRKECTEEERGKKNKLRRKKLGKLGK